MRRFITVLLCCLLTLGCGILLPGCNTTPQRKSGTLVIGTMKDDSEKAMIQRVIEAYQEENPDVKFEFDELVGGDYVKAVKSKWGANQMPDILWVADEYLTYLAAVDYILPLDEVYADLDVDNYYQSMLDLSKNPTDGKYYMVPRDYSKVVCFYNKDMFDAAGVAYPQNGWKYQDFLDTCAELKPKLESGIYAIDAMIDWMPVINTFVKGYGGSFVSDNGAFTLDTQANRDAIAAMSNLIEMGYTQNFEEGTAENYFLSKKAAMWFSSTPSVANVNNMVNTNYGVVTFPELNNSVIGTGTSGYAIGGQILEENKAIAVDFLKFILSEKGQNALTREGTCVPVLRSLAENKDADWRFGLGADIDNETLLLYPDRDVTLDYLNSIPDICQMDVRSGIMSFCLIATSKNYGGENPDYATLLANKNDLLERIMREYEESIGE